MAIGHKVKSKEQLYKKCQVCYSGIITLQERKEMATLLRLVIGNMWGSLLVGVLALALGGFAVVGYLTGADPNAQGSLRYLLFGIFFIAVGGYGIWNALQLRAKAAKK